MMNVLAQRWCLHKLAQTNFMGGGGGGVVALVCL